MGKGEAQLSTHCLVWFALAPHFPAHMRHIVIAHQSEFAWFSSDFFHGNMCMANSKDFNELCGYGWVESSEDSYLFMYFNRKPCRRTSIAYFF